ncbi:MAG: DinB family protein [Chloroflexota bacterium]
MDTALRQDLEAEMCKGGQASVRNLAAAEAAILRGQFNVAKVLRALAHSQRLQAMEAARMLASELDPVDLFRTVLGELESSVDYDRLEPSADSTIKAKLGRSAIVQQRSKELLLRSLKSLETHGDIMESDVAQHLWGCYGCGLIAEGDRPDACPVCGSLAPEFEWFGPFYATTHEHLGQLTPSEILTTLEAVPDQLAAISQVDDDLLARKPSTEEWCVKEILGHMLETELLFLQRVKIILAEQGVPNIDTPVPPWKLQEGKGYEKMPAGELLDRMRQVRSTSLEVVRRLGPKEWARRGTLRGTATTLLERGTWLANHDRGHLAQIRRLCGN